MRKMRIPKSLFSQNFATEKTLFLKEK